MTFVAVARDSRTYLALTAVASLGCYTLGGMSGLAGMGLALASGSFGAAVLCYMVQALSQAASRGGGVRVGTVLAVLGFFLKLPLYIAAWRLAERVGGAAPGCFLAGVVLVYSCLVARAMARP